MYSYFEKKSGKIVGSHFQKKSEKKSWVMNGSLVQFYPIKCATKGTACAKKTMVNKSTIILVCILLFPSFSDKLLCKIWNEIAKK